MAGRIILHVDMDAFYASVEERDDPSLRGRPVAIGGDPKGGRGRGVLCTANYVARSYGLRSAQPLSEAYRLCPHAVWLRPDFPRYKDASRQVMEVLAAYADRDPEAGEPLLEVVGLDEAYLDVTQTAGSWDHVPSLALSLQAAVRRATGLGCSVGAAPAKGVAKVASDHRKPHGVTAVEPDDVVAFLAPLPVGRLHGCGPKTAARLDALGYRTVQDLQQANAALLAKEFQSHGPWLHAMAHGDDPRPVSPDRGPRKSRGNESTFPEDVRDPDTVLQRAEDLLDGLLEDQRRDRRAWSTLTVKIRYRGFDTSTRSHTFCAPVEPGEEAVVVPAMHALLRPLLDGRPVRLVGVRFSNYRPSAGQRSLARFGLQAPRRVHVARPAPAPPAWRGQQILA